MILECNNFGQLFLFFGSNQIRIPPFRHTLARAHTPIRTQHTHTCTRVHTHTCFSPDGEELLSGNYISQQVLFFLSDQTGIRMMKSLRDKPISLLKVVLGYQLQHSGRAHTSGSLGRGFLFLLGPINSLIEWWHTSSTIISASFDFHHLKSKWIQHKPLIGFAAPMFLSSIHQLQCLKWLDNWTTYSAHAPGAPWRKWVISGYLIMQCYAEERTSKEAFKLQQNGRDGIYCHGKFVPS